MRVLPVVCHLGNVLALQQPGDQLAGALALHLRIWPQDDAMREHRFGERLDVVRQRVAASEDGGQRLACVKEVESSSRAGAQRNFRVAPRAADEPSDVLAKL